MKRTLFLVRHGETLFNQQKKIQGWCDSPLTQKGVAQACMVKKYFLQNNIRIDSAYTSTSERAVDTLELITSKPYTRIKELKEWNFGTYEGESVSLNPPLPYGDYFEQFGGEREHQFRTRVSTALQKIMNQDKGENILVVSHGAACRQFMRNWEHKSTVDQKSRIGNCCVLKFDYEDEQFTLVDIINHEFSESNAIM